MSAVSGTGYANVRLTDSSNVNDDIKFIGNNGVYINQTDANTITVDGTTYTVSAVSGTGYANVRLTSSNNVNDNIKFIGSGATTVAQTDANTITISSTDTDTTYTISAVSGTGYANVRLTSSGNSNDDVKFIGSGIVTVSQTDADTSNPSPEPALPWGSTSTRRTFFPITAT